MSFKQEIRLQIQFSWRIIPKSLDFHCGNQEKLAVFTILKSREAGCIYSSQTGNTIILIMKYMHIKHSGIKYINTPNSQACFYLVGYCIEFNNAARSSSRLLAHNIKHFSNKFL